MRKLWLHNGIPLIDMDLSDPKEPEWKLISPYGLLIIKDKESYHAAKVLLSVLGKTYD